MFTLVGFRSLFGMPDGTQQQEDDEDEPPAALAIPTPKSVKRAEAPSKAASTASKRKRGKATAEKTLVCPICCQSSEDGQYLLDHVV